MSNKHEFYVAMTCEGCSGAVTRVLKRVEGVQDIQCSIPEKKVVVSGSADKDVILAAIQKTGKEVRYVGTA